MHFLKKKIFFLENLNNFIIYNENYNFYVFSLFYSKKINLNSYFCYYFLRNNFLFFYMFFFKKNNDNYLLNIIRKFLIYSLFSIKFRFRMVGRGFYLYFKKNVLYFKLGFSHVIKLILPFNLKIKIKKKRKKNFISLLGNNFKNISFLLKIIRSFRGPNLYSKRVKGIALYNEFIPRGTNSYSKF